MPPVGFEPTISAGEWPQTYALDRAVTGTGNVPYYDTETRAVFHRSDTPRFVFSRNAVENSTAHNFKTF